MEDKILDKFLSAALRIAPNSEHVINEIVGKVFYYIC